MSSEGKRQIKIALSNASGRHEFVYTVQQLTDLIGALIENLRGIPSEPTLHEQIGLSEHPISVDSLGVAPHPDVPSAAILVVASGQLKLQFSVPIDDLLATLQTLTNNTEKDPNSPRHH
jgi:hypothetical protein